MPMTNKNKFTLTELLVVISIIIILASIGVNGYKKMAGEASLHIAAAGVRQIINNSIKTGKRYNVPIQILKYVPDNTDTKPTVLYGTSTSSLVAYWGFEGNVETDARYDFKLNYMQPTGAGTPKWTNGQIGMCYEFATNSSLTFIATTTSSTANLENFYIEAAFKIDSMPSNTNGTLLKYGNVAIAYSVDSVGNFANIFGTANPTNFSNTNDDIPDSSIDRPVIPFDGKWHTVGLAYAANVVMSAGTSKGTRTADASLFIDGKYIGVKKGITSSVVGDIQIGHDNFKGQVDEVKLFNYRRGSSYTPDLKNVFLIGTSVSSVMSSSEWSAGDNAYVLGYNSSGCLTTMACTTGTNNLSGGLMNINLHSSVGIPIMRESSEISNTTLEYTVASQIIKGTVKSIESDNVTFNSSSTLSSLPPTGYLLIDDELVHYSHFIDSNSVQLDKRGVGGTPSSAGAGDDYHLAVPIFINADGTVK